MGAVAHDTAYVTARGRGGGVVLRRVYTMNKLYLVATGFVGGQWHELDICQPV